MSGEMSSTRERIATEDVKEQTRPSRELVEDGGRGITEERMEGGVLRRSGWREGYYGGEYGGRGITEERMEGGLL